MLDLAFRPAPGAAAPLYRQLADHLAALIAAGRLAPGERVPPSRDLAQALGLSRNTVSRAYETLAAAGLLQGHVGRGSFVSALGRAASRRRLGPVSTPAGFAWPALFARSARELRPPAGLRAPVPGEVLRFDFRPGRVDAAMLPIAALQTAWQRALGAHLRSRANEVELQGHAALRAAIARALGGRGIACEPGEILLTAGAQQALDLVARTLVEPGDTVVMEDPGYFGAALAFRAAGAHLVGVSVDAEGLEVDELARILRGRRVKLLYTTPAAQLPTGATLSPERRTALLELADREQLPILEDDYGGEIRLSGPSTPALKTDDSRQQVIYAGTFSKALFPGLRLGYLVAAPELLGAMALQRLAASFQPSLVDQLALVELFSSDTLERHVRKVRRRYAERANVMRAALAEAFPAGSRVGEPAGAGTIWVELPPDVDRAVLARSARERGIGYGPGEACRLDGAGPPCLLLSFAVEDPEAIRAGIGELGRLVRAARSAGRRVAAG
jgi:DNA-binding transcriptional MocR family regulator